MNLTPIDVEQKAFTQALRGYQMDEVDDFLDEVVATLRSYEQRLREAQEKIRSLEAVPPKASAGDESEISRAILTAQRTADRLVAEARVEAQGILSQAEAETNAALERRDAERSRLDGEVSGMNDLVTNLRSKLAALAGAVSGKVDEMETELAAGKRGLFDSEPEMPESAEPGPVEPEEDTPSFSDIFPGDDAREVDITDDVVEAEVARVSSRPWERG